MRLSESCAGSILKSDRLDSISDIVVCGAAVWELAVLFMKVMSSMAWVLRR